MRVLHVITALTNGGAESQLAQFVVNDSANEHHVFSLRDAGFFGTPIIEAGVPLIEGGMPKGKLTVNGLKRLFSYIRSTKPDAIQTWMYHGDLVGGVVGRLAGHSNIVWGLHHTSHDKNQTSLSIRVIVKICAILSRSVPSSIVCCATATKDLHEIAGYAPGKLKVVFNGYDHRRFLALPEKRQAFRDNQAIAEPEFVIGMVGRWNPQKDHRNLIEALRMLRLKQPSGWRCLMVGPGIDEDNAELTRWIEKADLNDAIDLLGPRRDIEAIMSSIDVLVLPSAFGEAFPNVVAEAMLSGCPCIVTDVGDSATMVGEHGWVVPPKNPEKISACLETAMDEFHNGETWEKRGELSRKRIIDNFGLAKMIDAYTTIWRQEIDT